jgi:Uma2 family endonuclease
MAVLTATTTLTTAEEFLRVHGHAHGRELVRGHVREAVMPNAEHAGIEVNIVVMVQDYAKRMNWGRVFGGEVYIRLAEDPDTIRAADVCMVSYRRLPADQPRPRGPLVTMPEVVVEIQSPSDRMSAVLVKVGDYLGAGVEAVVLVDPDLQAIAVFRAAELPIRFHNGDIVTLPDVLPGFSAPLKSFFE